MKKQIHQRFRPYFEVGHKVQLQPSMTYMSSFLKGYHATIVRIEQRPDPDFVDLDTPEDLAWFKRIRQVLFWVKLDDPSGLDNYYQEHEILAYYRELQPLSPKMTKNQLIHYCKQCFLKEPNERRGDAYLQIMFYLRQGRRPVWPLSELAGYGVPEKGHDVDLINRFISAITKIRELAQNGNSACEIYDAQIQVCDDLLGQLIPKQRILLK